MIHRIVYILFAFIPTAAAAGALTYWSDITGQERTDLQFRMDSAKCELIKQQVSQIEEIRSENLSNQCTNKNDSACISSISSSISSIIGNTEASKAYKTCMMSFGWERYRAPDNGSGEINYLDGSKYQGNFRNGNFNGQGTLTYADGNKYAGEWENSRRNGQGTFIYASGNKYVGEWKNGERNGQGTFIFADDTKYVGEWKNGEFNGQGTFIYAGGNKYVGEWKNGERNGQGTFIFADGTKYVGEWKKNKLQGEGTRTYPDGSVSNRNIVKNFNGRRFGFQLIFENGAVKITDIAPGSPTEAANITDKSEIVKINNIEAKSITMSEIDKIISVNEKIIIEIKNFGNVELVRSKF